MKIYKNLKGHDRWFTHPLDTREYTVGTIVEKKVDDYNGLIKVYQPFGTIELQKVRLIRDSDYSVYVDVDGLHFVHLSDTNLTELSNNEYKAVIQGLKQEMNDRLKESMEVQQLLKELGEV